MIDNLAMSLSIASPKKDFTGAGLAKMAGKNIQKANVNVVQEMRDDKIISKELYQHIIARHEILSKKLKNKPAKFQKAVLADVAKLVKKEEIDKLDLFLQLTSIATGV